MRHKYRKKVQEKVKRKYLRYVLIDKTTNKAEIYHYKTDLASKLGISTRTLDRNINYSNEKYEVYEIKGVFL